MPLEALGTLDLAIVLRGGRGGRGVFFNVLVVVLGMDVIEQKVVAVLLINGVVGGEKDVRGEGRQYSSPHPPACLTLQAYCWFMEAVRCPYQKASTFPSS